jgi:hypothetical protein
MFITPTPLNVTVIFFQVFNISAMYDQTQGSGVMFSYSNLVTF